MNDVQGVKNRLKIMLREHRVTENKLADGNPGMQKRLNNQISHNSTLTVEVLLFVLEKFPDVSPEWLLLGKETQTPSATDVGALSILARQLEEKDRQLEEKDKQIDILLRLLDKQSSQ